MASRAFLIIDYCWAPSQHICHRQEKAETGRQRRESRDRESRDRESRDRESRDRESRDRESRDGNVETGKQRRESRMAFPPLSFA